MRKYLSFFKLKFSAGLQYRAAAIAGLLTQLFFGFLFIMIYQAFYSSGDSSTIDFDLKQLITYVWLNQSFYALISIAHRDSDLLKLIKNGDIAYELCRPQNLYAMWFTRILGTKLSSVVLRAIPLLLILTLIPESYGLSAPINLESLICFIIALILSSLLVTSLITLMYIIASYTIDDKGIMNIYVTIAGLFTGQVVPIPLFPEFLKNITQLLPFAYVSDFAFRIYTGDITGNNILLGLTIQITWLIITIILGLLISNKVLKRVTVQGG